MEHVPVTVNELGIVKILGGDPHHGLVSVLDDVRCVTRCAGRRALPPSVRWNLQQPLARRWLHPIIER